MHPPIDADVMPFVRSHRIGVLNAIPLLVFVILQYVIIAVFTNIARHTRFSGAVGRSLLRLLVMPLLALVLRNCRDRANHCQCQRCDTRTYLINMYRTK